MQFRIRSYILPIMLTVVIGCAQQGAPTGGPKDEDPPKVVRATPMNYSTQFTGKEIEITFDEFIQMGGFSQELVVSPPMEEKPVIKLKNKTLIIEFEEDLKENTTYTFNFGEGIKDLNEGNVLLNYEFVFSTGDYLDSLSVKGTLKNAFDLSIPESPISVMLYNILNDSLPLKEIPYYIGRADKEGNFAVNNLRPDRYLMFVLKDGNNNFIFDQQTEPIAFLDSSLRVDASYFKELLLASGTYDSTDFLPDTSALPVDTAGMSPDSIAFILDSLQQGRPDINSVFVDLVMFTEDPENQFITDYSRDNRFMAQIIFNIPLTDSFDYEPLYPEGFRREDYIEVFGKKRDTLTLWMPDSTVALMDTVSMKFSYTGKDTTDAHITKHDTLLFVYRDPSGSSKKKDEGRKTKRLEVALELKGGKQDIYRPLNIALDHPFGSIDTSKIDFFRFRDTIEIPRQAHIVPHPGNIRTLQLAEQWEPETKYRLVLYPGALTDMYMLSHDTVDLTLNTKAPEDYGKILLTLTNVTERVIIQLFQKETILRQMPVDSNGTYIFEYLDPATYRIKFIFDKNGNGFWDTGKYMEKLQPERVEFLPKDISVRANWDHDATYEMGTSNMPPSDGKSGQTGDEDEEESPDDTFRQEPGNDGFDIPVQGGNTNRRSTPSSTKQSLPESGRIDR